MVNTRRRAAKTAAFGGLLVAVVEDNLAAVQHELEQPDTQWVTAEGGLTALHLAAGFASPAVLGELLAAPALPRSLLSAQLQGDYTDPSVLHPLLESATVEQRLALGEGVTALHVAVHLGNTDAVRLLLAAKACPNVPDAHGRTTMHYVADAWQPHAATVDHGGLHATVNDLQAPHADIPGLLLAGGGDIFGPPASIQTSPLSKLCHAGVASIAASHAFLTHAAEQHAAGQWAPDPDVWGYLLRRFMQLAFQVGCQQFCAQLLPHLPPLHAGLLLSHLIEVGAIDGVASMLRSCSVSAVAEFRSRDVLTHAVRWQQPAIVQLLLLQHGAPVTVESLKAAAGGSPPRPGMLRMLLAAGPPPTIACPWACPVGALLNPNPWGSWRASGESAGACYRDAMVCMELLGDAGIRAHPKWWEEAPYPGHDHDTSRRRWLWHAYERPAWAPTTHQHFQPAFRAAARALLLAAHRASRRAGHSARRKPGCSTPAGLGTLPQDVLLHIIGSAAYPASAWV